MWICYRILLRVATDTGLLRFVFRYFFSFFTICLGFVPIMIASMFVMMKAFTGEAADEEIKAFEDAGKCTTEATMIIRTVASLNREDFFIQKYKEQLNIPLRKILSFFQIYSTFPLYFSDVFAAENFLLTFLSKFKKT